MHVTVQFNDSNIERWLADWNAGVQILGGAFMIYLFTTMSGKGSVAHLASFSVDTSCFVLFWRGSCQRMHLEMLSQQILHQFWSALLGLGLFYFTCYRFLTCVRIVYKFCMGSLTWWKINTIFFFTVLAFKWNSCLTFTDGFYSDKPRAAVSSEICECLAEVCNCLMI